MTYLTYENLSLFRNGTTVYPIFFGPVMIHLKKDFQAYLNLATELLKFDKIINKNTDSSILDIKCMITDDDPALSDAFKSVFKKTDFLLCHNHIIRNILKHLNDFNISDEEKYSVIEKIFGNENNRDNCLVFSKNKEEFYRNLNLLTGKWKNINHKFKKQTFDDWFLKFIAEKIYEFIFKPQ